jgi:hypothetical protein
VFDYVVNVGGKNASSSMIAPGASEVFTFDIQGGVVFATADFTGEISVTDSGEVAAYGAATFGSAKNSPIGAAHAPEPTTALLVGTGLCFLAASRRRGRA